MQKSFGGPWTEDKLNRLDKYLRAYTRIFAGNRQARYFKTVYIDAFAGSGRIQPSAKDVTVTGLFPELAEQETPAFLKGSAPIALEVNPQFDLYLFIERSRKLCKELENLKTAYPDKASSIQIERADANSYLKQWCKATDWSSTRAILFLDPFGMQVEWTLLEAIAQTHAIDVWLLFPLAVGVNRLLTRSATPREEWAARLTMIFGTEEWKSEFYSPTLFEDFQNKNADFAKISAYFVRRLRTIFTGVAENPLLLKTPKNLPLFLLCFATGSQKSTARDAALRIAENILERRK